MNALIDSYTFGDGATLAAAIVPHVHSDANIARALIWAPSERRTGHMCVSHHRRSSFSYTWRVQPLFDPLASAEALTEDLGKAAAGALTPPVYTRWPRFHKKLALNPFRH